VCKGSATQCLNNSVEICQANGQWSAPTTVCSAPLVCESYAPASCGDPGWAEWPMPNGALDVSNGAPHPASYVDNQDDTVTDKVTGLMWQLDMGPGTYTMSGAAMYCQTTFAGGGYHDWRLPSLIELVSLVDYGNAGFLVQPFNSLAGQLWSSTPETGAEMVNGLPQSGWYLASNGSTGYTASSSPNSVRCVR
jgi:hypothetical protein